MSTRTNHRRQESYQEPVTLDRAPPQNVEAERGVLGSLLLDPRRADDVALAVRSDDFYSPANRTIFEHMLALHNKGKAIDLTLLMTSLKKTGDFEAVGGMPYMTQLAESSPSGFAAVDYAKEVNEAAQLRGLVYAATEVLRDAYEPGSENAATITTRAEAKIFALAERRIAADATSFGDVLLEALAAVDEKTPGAKRGLLTGYADLDDKLGGMRPGQLIIVAGRPGMGKTQAAVCIASNMMTRFGAKVLMVSLEMGRLEVAERLISSFAQVPLHNLTNNLMSPSERQKVVRASAELSALRLMIDDTPERTMTEIAALCRRQKRGPGLDLVVVDYLTLVKPDSERDQREEQVAKVARRLKVLAREIGVPVICLAQLNRETAKSGDNIPQLHHLRSSGAIEQDADVVLFVHRPSYYATTDREREEQQSMAEIHVAKARGGQCGVVKLFWQHQWGRFENAEKEFT